MIERACRRTLWIAALLLLSLFEPGVADVLLVPEDHAGIAEALGAASYGDTVSLATGTYFEHDLVLPPGVSLLGRGSRESVVIDAQGAGRVIWGENLDENNSIETLTIRGGYLPSGEGAGARLSGPVLLRDLIVEENSNGSWGNGVGIYARGLSLIEDCVFQNNRTPSAASYGGGLCFISSYAGGSTLRRLDFIGNESGYGAALYAYASFLTASELRAFENSGISAITFGSDPFGPSFLIENSVVAYNEADGIVVGAIGTILNCTIAYCRSGIVSNGIPEGASIAFIEKSIIAFNTGDQYGGGVVCFNWGTYAYLSCSDVYGNHPLDIHGGSDPIGTDGNISENPLFCPESGPMEFFLMENSPCAPANNSCGVQIGAFPIGCGGTATQNMNWSRIKSLY